MIHFYEILIFFSLQCVVKLRFAVSFGPFTYTSIKIDTNTYSEQKISADRLNAYHRKKIMEKYFCDLCYANVV